MIGNLIEAIITYWDTTALSALTQLYYGERLKNKAGEYVTFSIVNSNYDRAMGASRMTTGTHLEWEQTLVQFTVISDNDSPADALNTADLLMAYFDDAIFSVGGSTMVSCDRQSYNLIPDAHKGWMVQIDYMFDIDKV